MVEPLTEDALLTIMRELWAKKVSHPKGLPLTLSEEEERHMRKYGAIHVIWDDGAESIVMTKDRAMILKGQVTQAINDDRERVLRAPRSLKSS